MIAFISTYRCDIVLVIFLVCGCYVAFKSGKQEELRKLAYFLVCQAEKSFTESGKGAEKKQMVVKAIHSALPYSAQFLFSERDISDIIEDAVKMMKDAFDNE